MRIVATIQARMGSTRLPGKTLMDVHGKPVLQHLIERVQRARTLDEVAVATSTSPKDDAIADLCARLGIRCFRGSENDVLGRVLGALEALNMDLHVELGADQALLDPAIIDLGVRLFDRGGYDYVTNLLKTTYPPGMEVRVYRPETLGDAADHLTNPADREHVILCVHHHPELYRTLNFSAPPEYFHPDTYLELDTPKDLSLVRAIYSELYPRNPAFSLRDVLKLLERHPDLAEINRREPRKWKDLLPEVLPAGVDDLVIGPEGV